MLIPNQTIEITIGGRTIKYYKSIGYKDIKSRQKITIPIEDLIETSHEKILVKCDYCKKIFEREYRNYITLNKKNNGLDLCHDCATEQGMINIYGVNNAMKVEEIKNRLYQSCQEKYGTKYVSQLPEIREKIKQTCLKNYGVEYPSQSDVVKEKIKKTCMERYGTEYYLASEDRKRKTKEFYNKFYNVDNCTQVEEIKNKAKQTCLKKYGSENSFGSEEIKKKIKEYWKNKYGVEHYSQTDDFKKKYKNVCLEKYGVTTTLNLPQAREAGRKYWQDLYGVNYPLQSSEFWKNVFFKKLKENNPSIWTSKPQNKVFNMLKEAKYNVFENYLFDKLVLDVALFIDDVKIDIEYDGWYWHQNKQRDRARDEILKSNGWKVLRIKGGDKVPTLSQLEEAINYLLDGHEFSRIVLPDWKEIKKEESA